MIPLSRLPIRGLAVAYQAAAVLALALAVSTCGSSAAGESDAAAGQASDGAAATEGGSYQAQQYIVLLDLSASQTAGMLADAQAFLDRVVAGLDFGDRVVLLEVHQTGVRDDVRRWADTIPRLANPSFISSVDRTRLQGAKAAVRSVAEAFFDSATAGRAQHTDLFATLHIAAEYARDGGGRQTVLVLLSDMLQSARGIEMQGLRRMPAPGWIEAQQAAGVLPVLDDACVLVVGANATSRNGAAVRAFWRAYFKAAGAHLRTENYRLIATGTADVGCGA